MKKLKIFLLLSILLCFGFALSSEVHAQGDGPKVFEVGDVLPATSQLRISWNEDLNSISYLQLVIETPFFSSYTPLVHCDFNDDDVFLCSIFFNNGYDDYITIYNDGYQSPFTNPSGGHNYCDIDISTLSEADRTVSSITGGSQTIFYWEDLNAPSGPKIFEVGDVLPAGYIKISWDFTDKFNDIFDEFVSFYIYADGDPENTLFIEIRTEDYGEVVEMYINYEEFHIDTPGETVISIPIPYTVNQIDADGDYDYYESVGDALVWEVVTEEDFIYYEAYREGYLDGYYLGYEHAREIYGYYDSRTDEWLSVTEYINRYGTDKLGQSDFYNNFDKYFIPAMIIVFGGAIVLTILKVFKGRE